MQPQSSASAAGRPAARERRKISTLQIGDRLDDDVYLITQRDLRTASNGSLYIHAILADPSGQLVARMWNATQALFDSLTDQGLVHVRGRIESYKGKPQCIIDGLRAIAPGSCNPSDFLPSTRQDVEVMWARLVEILRGLQNRPLRALAGRFLADPQFVANFKQAPAARQIHHAFLGGLLEHTLNLLELALLVCPRYPFVSRDLVLTGLFLHDCGKTRELAYQRSFDYTSEGQLIGHIVLATIWVTERAREVEAELGEPFPTPLLDSLRHIIVAHHGKYEFGSPKLPATAEAVMIHYLDNLDAKMNTIQTAIECDADESSDWTAYIPSLETRLFKPDLLGTRPMST